MFTTAPVKCGPEGEPERAASECHTAQPAHATWRDRRVWTSGRGERERERAPVRAEAGRQELRWMVRDGMSLYGIGAAFGFSKGPG